MAPRWNEGLVFESAVFVLPFAGFSRNRKCQSVSTDSEFDRISTCFDARMQREIITDFFLTYIVHGQFDLQKKCLHSFAPKLAHNFEVFCNKI